MGSQEIISYEFIKLRELNINNFIVGAYRSVLTPKSNLVQIDLLFFGGSELSTRNEILGLDLEFYLYVPLNTIS